MVSDSPTKLATQQSIKAYADSSSIVQVVNIQTGEFDTGTVTTPLDDTIPQNTEGNEFMTLAITPTNANNKLKIDVTVNISHSVTNPTFITSIFQNSIANAIASSLAFNNASACFLVTSPYSHK